MEEEILYEAPVLRKLNHVFGDHRKERELEKELDSIEAVLAELESAGGKQLSMEDVQLETRKLTQTQLQFSQKEEEMDEEETLADTVAAALRQIEEKAYDTELAERGISRERIRHYGFAFAGKTVLIG